MIKKIQSNNKKGKNYSKIEHCFNKNVSAKFGVLFKYCLLQFFIDVLVCQMTSLNLVHVMILILAVQTHAIHILGKYI